MKPKNTSMSMLRWIARIMGSALVCFTLVFLLGSLFSHPDQPFKMPSAIIVIIFIIWIITLSALVLAWWREGLGGWISLAGFVLMYLLNLFNPEASIRAGAIFIFLLFMIPSLLYIVYWWGTKDGDK
jgi:hypothetical protein